MQFDPALQELLLRKTGALPGEIPFDEIAAEEIPVVAKLVDPSVPVEYLDIAARFDGVVTGRVPLNRIVQVRRHENIDSLKASIEYEPDLAFSVPEIQASAEIIGQQVPPEGVSGRGVVVGIADWGCDVAHANFRDNDGNTRLLYLWDQRGSLQSGNPRPFGYGREFDRDQINEALVDLDPYGALGYDPADADPDGTGCHGTHVLDIAAGNGSALGASPGVAHEADIIFVHLKGNDTRPQDTLGDSARLLEAVRYIVDRAGDRPVAINLSLGWTGGPHDGETLVEQGLDALLEQTPGCIICMSTGNYFQADLHSSGQLSTGEQVDLRWRVTPRNDEIAEMEVWYPGLDVFGVELIDPYGRTVARAALGDSTCARDDDRIIASVYHRRHDPNNRDNQIDIFLWPDAAVGTWTTRLYGEYVRDGCYHAWIERDDPVSQSRFTSECAVQTCTTNTICNGHHTIAVGAYDAREPSHPLIPPSSAGLTRDNRQKPDIAAPGAGIRAARSSQPKNGYREMDGLTVKTGSSMAAPHVTGICALMFEAAGEYRLTAEEIRRILIDTARASPPHDETDRLRYGAGRVDAAAAVRAVRALIRPTVPAAEAVAEDEAEDEMDLMRPETVESETNEPEPHDLVTVGNQDWDVMPAHGTEEPADDAADNTFGLDDYRLRRRLAAILPRLLVEFGDSELQRMDEFGVPIYDKRQPLVFAPTDRRYSLTAGRFNYQAANFVYNTAYRLGYEVPVYPPHSDSSHGRAYHNTAATFEALVGRGSDDDGSYFSRFFEIVVWPGQASPMAIREGDLLLRGAELGVPFGHIAIIVDPILREMMDLFFASRDATHGKGIQCIDAGLSIHSRRDRYGRTLVNDDGIAWDSRLVLRFKEAAIDIARVVHQMERDPIYRRLLENGGSKGSLLDLAEFSPYRSIKTAMEGR